LIAVHRSMLLNPLIVMVAAAAGTEVCRAIGVNPHVHELLIAGGLCLLASTLGVLPIVRITQPTPASEFQAAFLGSILHMVLCLGGACAVIWLLHTSTAFVYWMIALYWLTLFGMCGIFVSRLRMPARPAGTLSQ
jgi:hypothetical protein